MSLEDADSDAQRTTQILVDGAQEVLDEVHREVAASEASYRSKLQELEAALEELHSEAAFERAGDEAILLTEDTLQAVCDKAHVLGAMLPEAGSVPRDPVQAGLRRDLAIILQHGTPTDCARLCKDAGLVEPYTPSGALREYKAGLTASKAKGGPQELIRAMGGQAEAGDSPVGPKMATAAVVRAFPSGLKANEDPALDALVKRDNIRKIEAGLEAAGAEPGGFLRQWLTHPELEAFEQRVLRAQQSQQQQRGPAPVPAGMGPVRQPVQQPVGAGAQQQQQQQQQRPQQQQPRQQAYRGRAAGVGYMSPGVTKTFEWLVDNLPPDRHNLVKGRLERDECWACGKVAHGAWGCEKADSEDLDRLRQQLQSRAQFRAPPGQFRRSGGGDGGLDKPELRMKEGRLSWQRRPIKGTPGLSWRQRPAVALAVARDESHFDLVVPDEDEMKADRGYQLPSPFSDRPLDAPNHRVSAKAFTPGLSLMLRVGRMGPMLTCGVDSCAQISTIDPGLAVELVGESKVLRGRCPVATHGPGTSFTQYISVDLGLIEQTDGVTVESNTGEMKLWLSENLARITGASVVIGMDAVGRLPVNPSLLSMRAATAGVVVASAHPRDGASRDGLNLGDHIEVEDSEEGRRALVAHHRKRQEEVLADLRLQTNATSELASIRLKDPGASVPKRPQRVYPLHKIRLIQTLVAERVARMYLTRISGQAANTTYGTKLVLSPVQAVVKPAGGGRLVTDYTGVNKLTLDAEWSTNNIGHILTQIREFIAEICEGDALFSKFDLKDGFETVPIDDLTSFLTAIMTPMGNYRPRRLMQGLKQAPALFQAWLDGRIRVHTITDALGGKVLIIVYVDDIIVVTPRKEWKLHVAAVNEVASRLYRAGARIGWEKSHFCVQKVDFVGFAISNEGVRLTEDRRDAWMKLERPATRKELESTLGSSRMFSLLLPRYSENVQALQQEVRRTKKKARNGKTGQTFENRGPLVWSEQMVREWQWLKLEMTRAAEVSMPVRGVPMHLVADASTHTAAWMLYQVQDGVPRPLLFGSRRFQANERRWCILDKESRALLYAAEAARPFLFQTPSLTAYTDSQALVHLWADRWTKDMQARWAREFEMIVPTHASFSWIQGSGNPVDLFTRQNWMEGQKLNELLKSAESCGSCKKDPDTLQADIDRAALLDKDPSAAAKLISNPVTIQKGRPEEWAAMEAVRLAEAESPSPWEAAAGLREVQPVAAKVLAVRQATTAAVPEDEPEAARSQPAGREEPEEDEPEEEVQPEATVLAVRRVAAAAGAPEEELEEALEEAPEEARARPAGREEPEDDGPEEEPEEEQIGRPQPVDLPGGGAWVTLEELAVAQADDAIFPSLVSRDQHNAQQEDEAEDEVKGAEVEDPEPNLARDEEDGLYRHLDGRLWIPTAMRTTLVALCHRQFGGSAHMAAGRLIQELRPLVYWSGMQEQIKRECARCEECQQQLPRAPDARAGQLIPQEVPNRFRSVSADVMGKFEADTRGNKYILTVMDLATNRLTSFPMPNKEAATVLDHLHFYFSQIGDIPVELIVDNGGEFHNTMMEALSSVFRVKLRFNTPNYPNGRAQIERVHGYLKRRILGLSAEDRRSWGTRALSAITRQYNTTANSETGLSPHFLTFGAHPRTWSGMVLGLVPRPVAASQQALRRVLQQAQQKNAGIREAKRLRTAERINEGRRQAEFRAGDEVWIWAMLDGNTPGARWDKGVVSAQVNESTFRARTVGVNGVKRYHASHLRKRDTESMPPAPAEVAPAGRPVLAGAEAANVSDPAIEEEAAPVVLRKWDLLADTRGRIWMSEAPMAEDDESVLATRMVLAGSEDTAKKVTRTASLGLLWVDAAGKENGWDRVLKVGMSQPSHPGAVLRKCQQVIPRAEVAGVVMRNVDPEHMLRRKVFVDAVKARGLAVEDLRTAPDEEELHELLESAGAE